MHRLIEPAETERSLRTGTASRVAVTADGAPKATQAARPRVSGKFLATGEEKLYVRGVTYGTFGLNADGTEMFDPAVVERDFRDMAAAGLNAVRVYTVPPRSVLDVAQRHGLRVMVGLPWEQHVDFLADRKRANAIVERVRQSVRALAGHPGILCYAIGNEIPAPIVRWLGAPKVEAFLKRLYEAAKQEDPDGLVTYVNYPSTEYLRLPFLDFIAFNVYLESQDRLDAYLARLHNLAGDRPLMMAEIGLDSRRNGDAKQAEILDWQVRTAFTAGCAGAFVFAWTDEWHRGGHEILDWDFGLVTREREPKPALSVVSKVFGEVPYPPGLDWPRVSVVCCTYNGTRTLRDTLEALQRVDYPSYEVIVVDDGSTLDVHSIASQYDVTYIRTENRGLSSARNTGMRAATGEIVAYIDDDAYPDPQWLTYLAATFKTTAFVGVGGPNIPPGDDGPIADCVAHAPGGPVHVLLDDREAEHIPGCNMAFRKSALEAIDGFDASFRVAGDDVDLCWRLQQRGWKIGFSPMAVVWHHRRNSVKTYLKQQRGYGKAEAILERKWPEKYNAIGHIPWAGRIYSTYLMSLAGGRRHIYHGTWGTALFQSVYQAAPNRWQSLLMMPESYLVMGALAGLSALGLLWSPLVLALPLLLLLVSGAITQAIASAWSVTFPSLPRTRLGLLRRRALTALLHLLQPLARLVGRLKEGLTPWRRFDSGAVMPMRHELTLWSETWTAPEIRLKAIEAALHAQRAVSVRGGDYDRWDLAVYGGVLGGTRALTTVEEHGAGRQLTRVAMWPNCTPGAMIVAGVLEVLTIASAMHAMNGGGVSAAVVSIVLGMMALAHTGRVLYECSTSMAALEQSVKWLDEAERATGEHLVMKMTKKVKRAKGVVTA
ncbi:MAG: glycosyltransferase [Gemmatimonas sp.]